MLPFAYVLNTMFCASASTLCNEAIFISDEGNSDRRSTTRDQILSQLNLAEGARPKWDIFLSDVEITSSRKFPGRCRSVADWRGKFI